MTALTVSAASDKNNSQRAFKEKTLGGGDGVHIENNTLSTKEQTDGSDRVINKMAGKIKIQEERQPVCVCVCVHMSAWDLLPEQLAADATPQLGPGVVVPREYRSLGLSRQVLLVLVQATVLLHTLTDRVQVHIGYQNLRHPRSL